MLLHRMLFTSFLRLSCDCSPFLIPNSWNQLCWLWLPNYVLFVCSCSAANQSVRFVMLSIAQWILNCLFNRPPGSLPYASNRPAFLKSLCTAWWPHKQTTYLLVWTLEITRPNFSILQSSIFVHGLILALSWRRSFSSVYFGLRSLSVQCYYINIPSSCIPVC